jgi:hypothetical protein
MTSKLVNFIYCILVIIPLISLASKIKGCNVLFRQIIGRNLLLFTLHSKTDFGIVSPHYAMKKPWLSLLLATAGIGE